jgi:hypothetical protein
LSDLLSDPQSVSALTPEEARALLAQIVTLAAPVIARLIVEEPVPVSPPVPGPDQLVRLKEAATLLGMRPARLHRNQRWRDYGGFPDLNDNGKIKFHLSDLQRHVREAKSDPKTEAMSAAAASRARGKRGRFASS